MEIAVKAFNLLYRKFDCRCGTWYQIQKAEPVNIQDPLKQGNIEKSQKIGGIRAQCPVFLTEIKPWDQWSKIAQYEISVIPAISNFV